MQVKKQNESLTTYFLPTKPDEPFLLAADIDGTLLGDEDGEEWLKVLVSSYSKAFYLAFVTGRTLSSVMTLVQNDRLLRPDYVCGFVGTELVACDDPRNTVGTKYAAQVSSEWDLETIYALGEREGIQRQEFLEGQPRFQAGFYWDGRAETLTAFRRRLANQEGCHILPSSGKYIDVLPDPLGKGKVARFLQQELDVDPTRVVVAGDTGNDREMFDTGFKGIVPANALEELKAVACHPWHYHSPFSATRGVLDGLCHFGFVERLTY